MHRQFPSDPVDNFSGFLDAFLYTFDYRPNDGRGRLSGDRIRFVRGAPRAPATPGRTFTVTRRSSDFPGIWWSLRRRLARWRRAWRRWGGPSAATG